MSAEKDPSLRRNDSFQLDNKLAAYLASAAAIGATMARETQAAVVAHTTPQAFGINGEVNIDFDGDGTPEFQIDHDRVNLNGTDLDYLQLDKNDASSAANPIPINALATYSSTSGTFEPPFTKDYDGDHTGSWDSGDLAAWESQYGNTDPGGSDPNSIKPDGNGNNQVDGPDFLLWQRTTLIDFSYDQSYRSDGNGFYPNALTSGTFIDPVDFYDFSETDNAFGFGTFLRANRLIDEDVDANGRSLIDADFLGTPLAAEPHPDTAHFAGLGGATRYLGVRFDLHDEGYSNNLTLLNGPDLDNDGFGNDDPNNYWYGWIGIEITNEADATGNVTGWAYEDVRGVGITAGDVGPLSGANAVPEPASLIIAAIGGAALFTRFGWKRILRDKR